MDHRFNIKKCKSSRMKGYSGCMCGYCYAFSQQLSPWKAGFHGGPSIGSGEIFVARITNRHAFSSYGWSGANKKILFSWARHDGPLDKEMWKLALSVSKERADRLNLKEKT